MKWKEISKKFQNEWVLIEAKAVDEDFNLKEGKVIIMIKTKRGEILVG